MVKWQRPFPGACKQVIINGDRYVIVNDKIDEYYLARYRNRNNNKRHFETWLDLYIAIAGKEPKDKNGEPITDEARIRDRVQLETLSADFGQMREFVRDGDHYALDMNQMSFWRYEIPERLSRTFYRESDAVEWATDYLERVKGEKQLTVFDAI